MSLIGYLRLYGGVTVADLSALADKPWSPYARIPNQWDAADIPQQVMAKIVGEGLAALAQNMAIPYLSAISLQTGGVTDRVGRVASSQHDSPSPSQDFLSRLDSPGRTHSLHPGSEVATDPAVLHSPPLVERSRFNKHRRSGFLDKLAVQLNLFGASGFCEKRATPDF